MRVLYVVTRSPSSPRRGDQRRSLHLIEHLARRHEITVAIVGDSASAEDLAAVASLGVAVAHFPGRGWWRLIKAPFDRRPFQVLPYTGGGLRRAITRLAEGADLVHGHLIRSVPALPSGVPTVIDLVDALSLNMRRRAEHDRGPGSWLAAWEAGRVARYERRIMGRVSTIVAADDDSRALGGVPTVVPNGVDLDQFRFDGSARSEPVLVFAGNLGYFPNVDACGVLAREVLPRLRQSIPDARLLLAGARPSRAVLRLARLDGVEVVEGPGDLGREIARGAATVIPMRAGTGIQNKVLEAMAVGTPVITTARVAAAVKGEGGEHLIIAEGATEAADAVADLLADPAEASAVAASARRLVEEQFGWDRAADRVERVWEEAVG